MLATKQLRKMVQLQSENNQKAGGWKKLKFNEIISFSHKTALHCSYAKNSEALTLKA